MTDHVTVRGFVATDPRSTTLTNGSAVANFRLATTERWQSRDGTWTDGHTNWYTVVAYRTLANNVTPSIHKGDKVIVTGRLRYKTFIRQDGSAGATVEIEAESMGHDLTWGTSHFSRTLRTQSSAMSPESAPSPTSEGAEFSAEELGAPVPGFQSSDPVAREEDFTGGAERINMHTGELEGEHPDDGESTSGTEDLDDADKVEEEDVEEEPLAA